MEGLIDAFKNNKTITIYYNDPQQNRITLSPISSNAYFYSKSEKMMISDGQMWFTASPTHCDGLIGYCNLNQILKLLKNNPTWTLERTT